MVVAVGGHGIEAIDRAGPDIQGEENRGIGDVDPRPGIGTADNERVGPWPEIQGRLRVFDGVPVDFK